MQTDVTQALRDAAGSVVVVTGAPGTGKTSTARQVLTARVSEGVPPDAVLVLAASRVQAGRLRADLGTSIPGTHTAPLVRTASSLAFAVLRHAAAGQGRPEPRLLTGAEQDAVLRELLAGHAAGDAPGPDWPAEVQGALRTTGFRTQLRDLLMRAVEHDVDPDRLARLAEQHDRPEWAGAAQVMAEYDQVTALATPGAYDPAWICAAAADLLEVDEALHQRSVGALRLLVVDDAQELSASAVRLLRAVHRAGTGVVLLGDGDAVVQGFRGAAPERFVALADELAARTPGGRAASVVLGRSHRQRAELVAVTDRVASQIGVSAGAAHRAPTPAPGQGSVRAVTLQTAAQEAAYVAQDLRRTHLLDGVPWAQMAVIARSGAAHEAARRALLSADVPVRPGRNGLPLRQDPAARPLLLVYAAALRAVQRQARTDPAAAPQAGRPVLTPAETLELLTSPIGRADPVALRRARRALRRTPPLDPSEDAGDGDHDGAEGAAAPHTVVHDVPPPVEELLVAAVLDPAWFRDPLVHGVVDLAPLVRLARALDATRCALLDGGDAHEVLWALWRSTGLAPRWERQALAGGAAGVRADRHLDAVMVLFGAAEDYVGRLRRRDARGFLEHVAEQEVAPDSLVARGHQAEGVDVLTPFAAAGSQWDVVAVVGVQQGVWPDLRLRDSLLGAQALVEVVHGRPVEGSAGVRAAHRQGLADELRQFHVAVSRARVRLLVTAVASTDEAPSEFLSLVDQDAATGPPTEVPAAPTLRSWVARLRRDLVLAHHGSDTATRDHCADLLQVLATEGVPGAGPHQWWDTREVSTTAPRVPDGPVRVSPSKVESFTTCALRWLLTSHGGDSGRTMPSAIGTLVHEVIAGDPEADGARLQAVLRTRWPELRLPSSWVTDRERVRAEAMIESYLTYRSGARDAGRTLVAVEVSGTACVGRAEVRGQVDRLERDADGRFVVIDLKTGSRPPALGDMPRHPQLGAYQVSIEAGAMATETGQGARSGGAGIAHIGKNAPRSGRPRWQAALEQEPDPRWAHTLVEHTAEQMAGSTFPAVLGEHCRTCPVTLSCPLQPEGDHR